MSAQPLGTIYDQGYRHYDGPREGRARAIRALAAASARRAFGLKRPWKTKIIPFGLIVAAFAPVVVFLGIRVLTGDVAAEFLSYEDYLGLVGTVVLLFSAMAAPELLCPERRQRVLTLIFTRPVSRTDYLVAKLGTMWAVMATIVALPPLLLFLGFTLTDTGGALDYVREHLDDGGAILAAGGALTVYYATLALAVASFTERRALAVAAYLGIMIGSTVMTNLIAVTGDFQGERWLALASLTELPAYLVNWLFGGPGGASEGPGTLAGDAAFSGLGYLGAMGVASALALLVLAWRIRRVQA